MRIGVRIDRYGEFQAQVADIVGKRVLAVNGLKKDSEAVDFLLSDGSVFEMAYHPDCYASCYILELDCAPEDFVDQVVLSAEVVSNAENPPPPGEYAPDSYTWTFVKFSTSKGHFTVRWYGESNGYYSETPSFTRLPPDEARRVLSEKEQVLLDRAEEMGWSAAVRRDGIDET